MHNRILVPVDLAHLDKLTKALDVAATLAKAEGATLIYTGVTGVQPSSVARSPEEYDKKLKAFAEEQSVAHGVPAEAHMIKSHDVSIELNKLLTEAVKDVGADLVVMASHVPGVGDHMFHSHGGQVASDSPVSVYLVR